MKTGWITRKFIRVVSIPITLGWLLIAWGMQQARLTFVMIGLGVVLLGLLPFIFVSWVAKRSWWFNNSRQSGAESERPETGASFEEVRKGG